MSTQLDELKAQVAASDTVMAGAAILLQGIGARLTAAGTDPAALSALASDLKTNTATLAKAVLDNTPSAPADPAPAAAPAATDPAAPTGVELAAQADA